MSNVSATGCKLSWEKSKDSGGLPLEYLIEKFCVASDAWSKQAVTSNTNFTVNDLGKYKKWGQFYKNNNFNPVLQRREKNTSSEFLLKMRLGSLNH